MQTPVLKYLLVGQSYISGLDYSTDLYWLSKTSNLIIRSLSASSRVDVSAYMKQLSQVSGLSFSPQTWILVHFDGISSTTELYKMLTLMNFLISCLSSERWTCSVERYYYCDNAHSITEVLSHWSDNNTYYRRNQVSCIPFKPMSAHSFNSNVISWSQLDYLTGILHFPLQSNKQLSVHCMVTSGLSI